MYEVSLLSGPMLLFVISDAPMDTMKTLLRYAKKMPVETKPYLLASIYTFFHVVAGSNDIRNDIPPKESLQFQVTPSARRRVLSIFGSPSNLLRGRSTQMNMENDGKENDRTGVIEEKQDSTADLVLLNLLFLEILHSR